MTAAAKAQVTVDVQTWMHGVKSGKTSIINALLELGANVNARFDDGRTALMYVASLGNTSMLQTLLRAGADVNAKRENGFTALIDAVFNGHIDAVQDLIRAGADLQAETLRGSTAENWANARGFNEISQLLKDAENVATNAHVQTVEAATEAAAINARKTFPGAPETSKDTGEIDIIPAFDTYLSELATRPLFAVNKVLRGENLNAERERKAADEEITTVPAATNQAPDVHTASTESSVSPVTEDSPTLSVEKKSAASPQELSATTDEQYQSHIQRPQHSLIFPLWRTALIALVALLVSSGIAYKLNSSTGEVLSSQSQVKPVAEITRSAPEPISPQTPTPEVVAVVNQADSPDSDAGQNIATLKQSDAPVVLPATVNIIEKPATKTKTNPATVEYKADKLANAKLQAPKTLTALVNPRSGKNQIESRIPSLPRIKTAQHADKSITLTSSEKTLPARIILYPRPASSRNKVTEGKPSVIVEPAATPKKKVIQWP